jgi:chaperonin cofactor prefoldin
MNFIGIIGKKITVIFFDFLVLLNVLSVRTARIDLEELKSQLEYQINKVTQTNNAIQKRIEDLTSEINHLMAENLN